MIRTRKWLYLGLSVLAAVSSSAAWANNYGMAGCGLGSMVFQDKPGKIQILAATTNNVFVPQTSAISSGTSNCVDGGAREEASLYITMNQEALKKDISRGNGETLSGLTQILGCEDGDKVGTVLQQNYGAIFSESNDSAKAIHKSIESTIQQNVAGTCRAYI